MHKRLLLLSMALAVLAGSAQTPSQGSAAAPGLVDGAGRVRPALVLEPVEHVPGTAAGGQLPVVTVDDQGTATVVWRHISSRAGGVERSVLLSVRRGIGGHWSKVQRLPCGHSRCGGDEDLGIGVDAAGDVTLVWSNDTSVMAARRPAGNGRAWTTPRVIGHTATPLMRYGPPHMYGPPSLAVARNGRVFVTWAAEDQTVWVVQRPAHGPWKAPVTLGPGWGTSVATSPTGSAVVTRGWMGGVLPRVWATRFVPGRGWRSPRRLGTGDFPTVAVGSRGQALAVWNKYGSPTKARQMTVWGRWRPFGRPAGDLGGVWTWDLATAIDRAGRYYCAWLDDSDTGDPQWGLLATRTVGGTWSRTEIPDASGRRGRSRVLLSLNRHNDVAVIFSDRIVLRPHGSTWTRPATVGAHAGGILPRGSALRVWWAASGLNAQRVHVR